MPYSSGNCKAFFTSPVGYFVLAVLFAFSGFFFFQANLMAKMSDLSYLFRQPVYHCAAFGAAHPDDAPAQRRQTAENRPGPADRAGQPDGIALGKNFSRLC